MRIGWCLTLLFGVLTSAPALPAQFDQGREAAADHAVLALSDRPAVENRILNQRLDTLLPRLMQETGIDLWLVLAREYAEDPVYFTLVPQPTFAARRTTMLIFYRGDNGLQKLAVNRYPLGEPYESVWAGGDLDEQWQALADLIKDRDPARIGSISSEDNGRPREITGDHGQATDPERR